MPNPYLRISETPHLQLANTSSNALYHGAYPDHGDNTWAENLAAAIAAWHGSPAAPPPVIPFCLRTSRMKLTASCAADRHSLLFTDVANEIDRFVRRRNFIANFDVEFPHCGKPKAV